MKFHKWLPIIIMLCSCAGIPVYELYDGEPYTIENRLDIRAQWLDESSCYFEFKNLSSADMKLLIKPVSVLINRTREKLRVKTGERIVEYCDAETGECYTRAEPVWGYKNRVENTYSNLHVDRRELSLDSAETDSITVIVNNKDEASRAFNLVLDVTYVLIEGESGRCRIKMPVELP